MISNIIPYLFVFLAGVIVPPAVAFNAALGRYLKSPILSALAVMVIGGISIGVLTVVMRERVPSSEELSKLSWYVWFGGVLISFYMLLMNYNVPKVGVGLATALVLAGQILTSLAIDHFGLFGLPQASISIGRACGALAIIGGVVLVKLF